MNGRRLREHSTPHFCAEFLFLPRQTLFGQIVKSDEGFWVFCCYINKSSNDCFEKKQNKTCDSHVTRDSIHTSYVTVTTLSLALRLLVRLRGSRSGSAARSSSRYCTILYDEDFVVFFLFSNFFSTL